MTFFIPSHLFPTENPSSMHYQLLLSRLVHSSLIIWLIPIFAMSYSQFPWLPQSFPTPLFLASNSCLVPLHNNKKSKDFHGNCLFGLLANCSAGKQLKNSESFLLSEVSCFLKLQCGCYLHSLWSGSKNKPNFGPS